MNAEQLADQLTHSSHQWGFAWPIINDAAALLRKQDAAIKQLRDALALMAKVEKLERELAEANKPPTGTAPCARFCEHTAFVIDARQSKATIQQLERENAELKAKIESMTKVKNFIEWGGL